MLWRRGRGRHRRRRFRSGGLIGLRRRRRAVLRVAYAQYLALLAHELLWRHDTGPDLRLAVHVHLVAANLGQRLQRLARVRLEHRVRLCHEGGVNCGVRVLLGLEVRLGQQQLLRVDPGVVRRGGQLLPRPLAREPAGLHVVRKLKVHELDHALLALGVEHGVRDLDAALGVAGHHVRAGKIQDVRVHAKRVHARVLQEASHDLVGDEPLRLVGDVCLDAADAAYYQHHAHAGAACLGNLVDHVAVGKGVHLHEHLRGLAGARTADLAVQAAHDERLQACRRYAQVAVAALQVAKGQVPEERVAILRDAPVRREQHEVRVELRGLLVEVSGAQAGDPADARRVVVGDLTDLGVYLEALLPVDHRAAGLLQPVRPLDVVRLVKAGAQLHQDGDLLAVF